MTTVQTRRAGQVSGRRRAAAIVVIAVAAGVLVGTALAHRALLGYQFTLNLVGVAALAYAALQVWRGAARGGGPHGGRRLAIALCWLATLGVVAESGDYQARKNVTSALGASNTAYFLPVLVWGCLLLLLGAAIAVTTLTKRAKGEA